MHLYIFYTSSNRISQGVRDIFYEIICDYLDSDN